MVRLVAVVLLLLPACAPAADSGGIQVVAAVYPLAWMAQAIAPDAQVLSLGARGTDPHDLELTVEQRAAVQRAALVAYLGDIGFQPQVERGVADAGGTVLAVRDVAGPGDVRPVQGGAGTDPHMWFDARLMARVADAMGEALATADPPRGAEYRANAADVATTLTSLAGDIDALLRDCVHDQVVLSHEAYAYLLAPYGLQQRGISRASAVNEASPADITRLTAVIRTEGIKAVLSEPVEGRADAEAVAREAGVRIVPIYSLDIVNDEQAARGYPALLREQAEAVATAAQCTSQEPAA